MSQVIASTYEILEEIGSGGGGIVYLGRHLRLNKSIVLKSDKRKLSAKPEVLRREVDALKNLSHTYIPQVYDFVSDGEHVYTVMDYIEGDSFDKLIKRGESFSQRQIVEWACQLLEALCYLHGQPPYGILHGDIKPANIMLRPAGDICLIDYNIALALGEDGAVAVGRSPGYASPEHYGLNFSPADTDVTGPAGIATDITPETSAETVVPSKRDSPVYSGTSGKKIIVLDVRSDIYSLGATLYHLLTGRKPAAMAPEVTAIAEGECAPTIAGIIHKAMNPDPDARYQTAAEMLFDFTHLRANDPRTKRHKRNRRVAGLSLAVMFLASGFVSFVGLKQMERTQTAYALSEYSANALRAGDAPRAAAYALDALPERNSIFVPPYIPQAQKALAEALGVYDLTEGYKPFKTLTLPSAPLKIALAENGKTAAVVYAYEVAVIDMETASVTIRLSAVHSALADVEFIGDRLIAYAGERGICLYDTAAGRELWSGEPATEIAVSADGQTVAAVFKDEGAAVIYGADGVQKGVISFDGRGQWAAFNDTFANPNDNLLALNQDGSRLAASFADGSLMIFDLNEGGEAVELLPSSEFSHFEGGFSGIYFAFSAAGQEESIFAVVDVREMAQTGGFASDGHFGVATDEGRIFVSSENILAELNPVDGEQREAAFTETDILAFDCGARHTVVATRDNGYAFFDGDARLLSKYEGDYACDFVAIAEDYALTGGRDTPVLRILKREAHEDARVFTYEAGYVHDEARINEDRTRVMLFSNQGFRLYDMEGRLLREVSIPDPERVYDQQYSQKSGNLAVLYRDALRIYSGENGETLFEETALQSTFYAPYGVSILDRDGGLTLVDLDTAVPLETAKARGEFAAFCGMTVDSEFLKGQKLLGAARLGDGYVFAAGGGADGGVGGAVYGADGKKRFDMAAPEDSEVFFTDDWVILSPLHGTPVVYNLETGKEVRTLEKDAYLTYVTPKDGYVITEYISAGGERFGILLDGARCQALAYLPGLAGMAGDDLLFDDGRGNLRQGRVYSIEELIGLAKGGG